MKQHKMAAWKENTSNNSDKIETTVENRWCVSNTEQIETEK